jgi:hypothetical protein
MSLLSHLESVFETLVEGGFRRLFGAPVQPIEVARALERVMLAERVVGSASVDVPNRYVAFVNPVEFERLSALRTTVERDAAIYLERRASELDIRPISPVRVELAPDATVSRSSVRAEARFEEEAPTADSPVEHTRRLELALPRSQSTPGSLILVGEDGASTRLNGQPLRIGRGPDNDLVISDVRVSRVHAVIEPDSKGWVLRDLQSTNGTYLNGERVKETRLDGPAELSLGGYQLALRPG